MIDSSPVLAQSAPPGGLVRIQLDENSVDLASGNLIAPQATLSIGDPDQGGMIYQRVIAETKATDNYDIRALAIGGGDDGIYVYFGPSVHRFAGLPGAGNIFESIEGNGETVLDVGDGTFVWRGADGTTINLAPAALNDYYLYPTIRQKANGERETFYIKGQTVSLPIYPSGTYIANINRIQSVTSSRGYQVKFEYLSNTASDQTSTQNFLTKTSAKMINNAMEYCAPNSDNCTALTQIWPSFAISRSSSGTDLIESITNALGHTTQFRYGNVQYPVISALTGIRKHGSLSDDIVIGYGNIGRVASLNNSGIIFNYAFTDVWFIDSMSNMSLIGLKAEIKSSSGQTILKTSASLPKSVISDSTDALNRMTSYTYDTQGRKLTTIYPEGNSVGNTYDARGNITQTTRVSKPVAWPGTQPQNIVTLSQYPSSCAGIALVICNKPIWTRDAKGYQTDYTYSAQHGGLLSELKPAPSAGAARPLTLKTFAQRYAWVKNASGNLVQNADPIWMPVSITQCQTVAGGNTPVCDATAQQTVTTNEYGAPGTSESLLVKGVAVTSGGVTLRTCYTYDIFHNRTSETQPNANLASCP